MINYTKSVARVSHEKFLLKPGSLVRSRLPTANIGHFSNVVDRELWNIVQSAKRIVTTYFTPCEIVPLNVKPASQANISLVAPNSGYLTLESAYLRNLPNYETKQPRQLASEENLHRSVNKSRFSVA